LAALRCLGEIDREIRASQDRDRRAESAAAALRHQLDELSLALELGKSTNSQRVTDTPGAIDRARYRELLDEFDRKTDLARGRRVVGQRERRTFESLRRRALSSLPPAVVSAYEALIQDGEFPALVDLNNGHCGSCGERVGGGSDAPALLAADVIRCTHCGRFLALTGLRRSTPGRQQTVPRNDGR
jgi:predicted  nucleic acid-binding Zn-ribbon protein